jgi:AraC family transcriptional regulator, positive regulator of tynA and feaB
VHKLFCTDDVHPRERFGYWHEIACKTICTHDSKPAKRSGFKARIDKGTLDGLDLVQFSNLAMTVDHTARHAAQVSDDDIFLCRQVSGTLGLEQDAREVVLQPGDIALIDPLLSYSGTFSDQSHLLIVKLPRRELEARVGKCRQMVARHIKPQDAITRLASSHLAHLPAHAEPMDRVIGEFLKVQTLDLIALTLATSMRDRVPRISSARAVVSMSVRMAIEARLTNPQLDVSTVSAVAGVSARYANAVLAKEGTSIARLILERRLARCRSAIEDPQQATRTLSEIAYGWGFSDMTHFSRSFRNAYGVLPSEFRRRTAGGHSAG